MIGPELLENIARQEQTSIFPNIVREYVQHLFLTELYQLPESEKLLFKGGTALRIVYNSPRFSEDLDFSLFGVPSNEIGSFVDRLFLDVLAKLESTGIHIEIDNKSARTSGGYFGLATLNTNGYPPINIEINISSRGGNHIQGEIDSITNNFVPTYTLYHLPQKDMVDEKIFGALIDRKKPRDYYDLYFLMRKGMLSPEQKKHLSEVAKEIIDSSKQVDFQGELGIFLPASQQSIIRDFPQTLEREMRNQLSFNQ
ncbi:MAG: nucleotidyl transferase AbiEii/AbiGii toxin family protein [Candidatus Paceibacterota bacterium]